jgi:hypothetical protein
LGQRREEMGCLGPERRKQSRPCGVRGEMARERERPRVWFSPVFFFCFYFINI